jgi:hypothetical protein
MTRFLSRLIAKPLTELYLGKFWGDFRRYFVESGVGGRNVVSESLFCDRHGWVHARVKILLFVRKTSILEVSQIRGI